MTDIDAMSPPSKAQRMYDTLKRISQYRNAESLCRHAERDYGLPAEEAIVMAYENVILEAKAAIRHMRRPQA